MRGRRKGVGPERMSATCVGFRGGSTYLLRGTGLRDGHGDTEYGIRTELGLVVGSVELDEEVVNLFLRSDGDLGFDQLGSNGVVDGGDGLGDACNSSFSSVAVAFSRS